MAPPTVHDELRGIIDAFEPHSDEVREVIDRAFAAGVASQQAEIERLKKEVERESRTAAQYITAFGRATTQRSRAQAVVEAARQIVDWNMDAWLGEHVIRKPLVSEIEALRAALAALDGDK